jgi:hypothetical protein
MAATKRRHLDVMTRASIFVWRLRLCLVLTAVGLALASGGDKNGPAKQEQMLSAVSHVKCPPSGGRNSAALESSGSRSASPAESDTLCAQLPGQAVIRTGSAQKFKSDVKSPALGALGGQSNLRDAPRSAQ